MTAALGAGRPRRAPGPEPPPARAIFLWAPRGRVGRWRGPGFELGRGDLVMVERVDRTRLGDKHLDLPCCGVFEMSGGKITVWRDYFDLATYTRAAG